MKAPVFKLSLVFALALFSSQILYAQVGIGTTTARKTLEVAGDAIISGNVDIGTFNPLADNDSSTFLIQESDNSVKSLDVSNPTASALGYIQEYIITNMDEDWVFDFDTGIDASEYVLITTSASFDQELLLTTSNDAPLNSSLPYTATFVSGGTWHIIADYPMGANPATVGTWTIKTLIFSNDLSKQFGTVTVPMSDGTTGTASSPIVN